MTSKDPDTAIRAAPDPSGPSRPPMERVTVNLTAKAAEALREATELTGDSKTDTINRALQVYAFIQRALQGEGALYTRASNDAPMERVHIL